MRPAGPLSAAVYAFRTSLTLRAALAGAAYLRYAATRLSQRCAGYRLTLSAPDEAAMRPATINRLPAAAATSSASPTASRNVAWHFAGAARALISLSAISRPPPR